MHQDQIELNQVFWKWPTTPTSRT